MTNEYYDIAKNIKDKIDSANRIMIISSTPVDDDTLGTSLSMQWYLKEKGKEVVDIITLFFIPDYFRSRFTGIENVKQRKIDEISFDFYDLVLLVDANDWGQLFGEATKEVLEKADLNKFVHIDHHPEGQIKEDLKEYSLTKKDSCTAKIVYDYFIKDSNLEIPQFVAEWMYMSLIYDTYRFMHYVFIDTFEFADTMIGLGANHDKATDMVIPKDQMLFMQWALQNLQYFPEIKTTLLVQDEKSEKELGELLGKDWVYKRVHYYFMESVPRRIEGYDYHITISRDLKNKNNLDAVNGAWRTRNYGDMISIEKLLKDLGFKAGGHFGAGGFSKENTKIKEESERIIEEMKKRLGKN